MQQGTAHAKTPLSMQPRPMPAASGRRAARALVSVLASLALALAMLPAASLMAPAPALAADTPADAHGSYIGITADGDYVDVAYASDAYTCTDASGADVTASTYVYQVCTTTNADLGTVATLVHVPDSYVPVSMPAKHVSVTTETADDGTATSKMVVESKAGGSYAVTGSTLYNPDGENYIYFGTTTDGSYVDVVAAGGSYTCTDAQGNVRTDVWVWQVAYYNPKGYRVDGVLAMAFTQSKAHLCAVPDGYKSGDACPQLVQGRYGTFFTNSGFNDGIVICKDIDGNYVSAADEQGKARADVWKWTITALGSASENGKARLVQIPSTFSGASLDIDSQVTSKNGNVYEVISANSALQSFASTSPQAAAAVTSLSVPATLLAGEYGVLAQRVQPYYSGLQAMSVGTAGTLEPTIYANDGVLFSKTGALLLYPRGKADESYQVPGSTRAIGAYAFSKANTLKRIVMPSALPGLSEINLYRGLGAHAFEGCAQLEAVEFPEDGYIGCQSDAMTPFGGKTFAECTALKSITLPHIEGGGRNASIWQYHVGSKYAAFASPMYTGLPVFEVDTFKDCSSLESVTFRAGNDDGMTAYFSRYAVFSGCTSLKSVVYEDRLPMWEPIIGGYSNTKLDDYTHYPDQYCDNFWQTTCGLATTPTQYCAVNYYLVESDASAADIKTKNRDSYASERIARVEYAHGTSTASIAINDKSALASALPEDASYVSSDVDAYNDGDLTQLDPNAVAQANAEKVARANGIEESAVASTEWCWKLGDGEQGYAELTNSCCAWLAPRDDLSSGRLSGQMINAARELADAMMLDDDSFDEVAYILDASGYADKAFRFGACAALNTTGPDIAGLELYDAAGNLVPASDYKVTYERCAACTPTTRDFALGEDGDYAQSRSDFELTLEQLGDDETPTEPGLYRVTYTYTGNDGVHTGSLQQWMAFIANSAYINARNHMGGSSAAYTAERVNYAYSEVANGRIDYSSAPFEVSLVEGDVASAVIASAYAGLVRGHIAVKGATDDLPDGLCIGSGEYARTYKGESYTDAEMANWVFEDFEASRRSYGAVSYEWGSTALLCSPADVYDTASVAAYAYTKKAPVFFTEDDGTVSDDTLDNLAAFSRVALAGGTQLVAEDVAQQLAAQTCKATRAARGKGNVVRIGSSVDAGDACGFSLAVASALASSGGFEPTLAAVSDGSDPLDCIAALGFCAHGRSGLDDGFSLVATSTLDSKRVAAFLHSHQDEIKYLRVYGRNEENIDCEAVDFTQPSNRANLENLIALIWSSDNAAVADTLKVAEGDTAVLYGIQFTVGADNTLTPTGKHFGDMQVPPATCSLSYGGTTYTYTVPTAVADASELIEALPEAAGLADKEAVEAARAAYDALSKKEKALVAPEALTKLEQAEAAVAAAEAKAAEDAFEAAIDAITALPSNAGVGDKGAVKAARAAYEALTEEQKASVPADVLQKLQAAEASVAAAEKAEQAAKAGLAVGKSATVAGCTYKATSKSAVSFTKAKNAKSVTVPATVKIKGHTYKVTAIAKKSFTGAKIRTVTIGKNVSKIAAGAFAKSKVAKLIVKTKKLKKPATVKNSFKGSKAKKVTVVRGGVAKGFVKKSFTKKNTKAKKMVVK